MRETRAILMVVLIYPHSCISIYLPYDFMFKLFCLSPFSKAWKTVTVITVRHDSESCLTFWLILMWKNANNRCQCNLQAIEILDIQMSFYFAITYHHYFHAYTASFILRLSNRESMLHVYFMLVHTFLGTTKIFKAQIPECSKII